MTVAVERDGTAAGDEAMAVTEHGVRRKPDRRCTSDRVDRRDPEIDRVIFVGFNDGVYVLIERGTGDLSNGHGKTFA
jgi:hypothetical protein